MQLPRQLHKLLMSARHVLGCVDAVLTYQCCLLQLTTAWKESSKMKDHKIEELNFQLGQVTTQLELARRDAEELQQQLAGSRAEVGQQLF